MLAAALRWDVSSVAGTPSSLSWCRSAGEAVAFAPRRGPLLVWTIAGPDRGVTVHPDAHSFLSDICTFRWHPQRAGKVAFGHVDGSLSLFQPGKEAPLPVLFPGAGPLPGTRGSQRGRIPMLK